MDRTLIFIDGSNFYHGLKKLFENNIPLIDFSKFANKLSSGSRLIQILYYTAPVKQQEHPEDYKKQQRFLSRLQKIPYLNVELGRLVKRERLLKCPECENKFKQTYRNEKGVDIKIAVDILSKAVNNQYDIGILVSGDGDFVPLIEEIKRLNKKIKTAYFPIKKHTALSKSCQFIPLTKEYLKDCI